MQSRRTFIKYLICLLCGLFGIKYKPKIKREWSEKNYDYVNNVGVCTGVIYGYGYKKAIFNSKDYGVITLNGTNRLKAHKLRSGS